MDLISCVENFCKSHPEYSFTVRFHEPIAEKTTFKIGGTSLVFCEPNNLNSFCGFLEFLIIKKIKYFVLGGGSNIVFCDNEFPGIVLSTGKLSLYRRFFGFFCFCKKFCRFSFFKTCQVCT